VVFHFKQEYRNVASNEEYYQNSLTTIVIVGPKARFIGLNGIVSSDVTTNVALRHGSLLRFPVILFLDNSFCFKTIILIKQHQAEFAKKSISVSGGADRHHLRDTQMALKVNFLIKKNKSIKK